jgi:paraquat-inducible protein A
MNPGRIHANAVLNAALLLSFGLFILGIWAPVLTFESFFIFSNQVSVLSGILALLRQGYFLLFALLFAFSILLPLCKLGLLFHAVNTPTPPPEARARLLERLARFSRWSMLDVFVAALLIVTIRLGAIARVEVHYGLYAFAASVLLSMVISVRVVRGMTARS